MRLDDRVIDIGNDSDSRAFRRNDDLTDGFLRLESMFRFVKSNGEGAHPCWKNRVLLKLNRESAVSGSRGISDGASHANLHGNALHLGKNKTAKVPAKFSGKSHQVKFRVEG